LNTLSHALPVVVNTNGEQTIDARALHTFLENGDHFTSWIQVRIKQYGFIENTDFWSFSANAEKPQGGRPSNEYTLTVSTAKELCMVERNAKGKQARLYFIECERRAKQEEALPWVLAAPILEPHYAVRYVGPNMPYIVVPQKKQELIEALKRLEQTQQEIIKLLQ
jgi:anti-repressor protein